MERLLTLEDFLALPEEKPNREFIHGRAVCKPMVNSDHIDIVFRLSVIFGGYVAEYGGKCGPEASVLIEMGNESRVLLPDLAYWASLRPRGKYPMHPPTLAVEVRSPSQSMAELRRKCRDYRAHGVDVAWLVDPDSQTVEVFEDGADGLAAEGVLTSAYLPGFRLELEDLFSVLD